jgi:CheY-like chemotaxis protein
VTDVTAEQFLQVARLWPDAALLLSADGTVVAASRGVGSRLGLAPDTVRGRGLAEWVAEPAAAAADYLRACAASPEPVAGALSVRGSEGRVIACHCEGVRMQSPSQDADDFVVLRLAPREDEGLRPPEEELSALRREVERLAEADRRKGEFLALLAYELRNPLAPILNALHVLSLSPAPNPAAGQARAILERQVRGLTRLVDDLLDVLRLEQGQLTLRRERLDLARLVRTAAEERRAALEEAGLGLGLDLPETPVWVMGEPGRLGQIAGRLLDRAAKRAGRGWRVGVRLTADPGGPAVLRITDTGAGGTIRKEEGGRGKESDRPPSSLPSGGLGLALVQGLAELHGGTVEASGAEFVVRLPYEDEPAALSGGGAAGRPPGQPLRILIVEDNRDAADSLRVLLQLLGHDVRVAYTGPDGVREAAGWRPQVVLSDIGLPGGLDGYGVARALRRDPATARALVVAITGYGSDDDRRRAREAGFDHALTKPADPAVLEEMLRRFAASVGRQGDKETRRQGE